MSDQPINEAPIEQAVEAGAAEAESQTAPEAQPESNSQDLDFSRKFSALSRKEKQLRERESEWEAKMAEMEQKLATYESQKEEPAPELPLEFRLKKNPLETLSEMGLSYDKLTELALNDGKLTSDMQMQLMRDELQTNFMSKIEKLESKLADKEKQEEEARYQDVVTGFNNEIKQFISQNPENYELISSTDDAHELIYDVIERHYNDTNEVLDIKDAATAVESYLEEEAKKYIKLKKISSLMETPEEPATKVQAPSFTLSNDHAATSSSVAAAKLSPEESKAKAAQLIKWT